MRPSLKEDEIVAHELVSQDEDELEPSRDSESEDFDINEAATELEKRAVRIDSSSITLPLCSQQITNIALKVRPRRRSA